MIDANAVRAVAEGASLGRQRRDTGAVATPADERTHFVTLVKPELLTAASAAEVLTGIREVLAGGGVEMTRCAVMPADDYLAHGYLLRHYPRLHRVAADGTDALTSDARVRLDQVLAEWAVDGAQGAYPALAAHPHVDPAALEAMVSAAGVRKLGSGSYVSALDLGAGTVAVLNGFLPALVRGYADATRLVAFFECRGERAIADLRQNLLGTVDPATAAPGTLRGTAAELADHVGARLSASYNGVHLSAGHLEGMFQAWAYFAAHDGDGLGATSLGRSLAEREVPAALVHRLATDQNLVDGTGTCAPHGATENLARHEVVDLVGRWAAGAAGW
ncbi:hypothetical protein [Umezawaea tangerina]|uniref:Nucleoside diphosphate kinase n=1 Tax=Umezawaea tangerina TaxID=84725 RepID=A0A2T0SVS7_9PSEU|nr:hypothetical protein [Umezawaea tangerina]PRY37508.1 hypothetical protein CLV43_110320 [Umezawaea tangerina]